MKIAPNHYDQNGKKINSTTFDGLPLFINLIDTPKGRRNGVLWDLSSLPPAWSEMMAVEWHPHRFVLLCEGCKSLSKGVCSVERTLLDNIKQRLVLYRTYWFLFNLHTLYITTHFVALFYLMYHRPYWYIWRCAWLFFVMEMAARCCPIIYDAAVRSHYNFCDGYTQGSAA